MNRNGPVIIIEDDFEDQELVRIVFEKLNYQNKIEIFSSGDEALDFLNCTDTIPFIILSDINLPKFNGFELRDKIKMHAKLQIKCIPYLFFSTASTEHTVIEAYNSSVQGFFIKPNSFDELENTIRSIMEYWKRCKSPNNFKLSVSSF